MYDKYGRGLIQHHLNDRFRSGEPGKQAAKTILSGHSTTSDGQITLDSKLDFPPDVSFSPDFPRQRSFKSKDDVEHGLLLAYLSDGLRGDEDLVRLAMEKSEGGRALQYATEEVRMMLWREYWERNKSDT